MVVTRRAGTALRRGAALGLVTGGLLAAGAPGAHAAGCTASGVRTGEGPAAYEPSRANPAIYPCADDADHLVRANASFAAGALRVSSTSLNAITEGPHPLPDGHVFAAASSAVDSVTITAGATTISASGLRAQVIIACTPLILCVPFPSAETQVAAVSVNGIGPAVPILVPVSIPLPGVGTLHLNHTTPAGGPPPLTVRALWLDGENGVPDVVVAEAGATLAP